MNNIVPDRIGVFDPSAPPVHGEPGQVGLTSHGTPGQARTGSELEKTIAIRPLHDRVLVQRDHAPEQTAGEIVVPDQAREKALTGTVIAVGPGTEWADGVFRKTQVKPGDRVMFSLSVNVPYADLVEDGELVMMAERDILGILNSDF